MTRESTPSSEAAAPRRLAAAARRCAALCTLLLTAGAAQAHKSSDSYLQLDVGSGALTVRWDIALRDLDAAVDIDRDDDGQLTWGEFKAAWPRIEAYALPRLQIDGCPLRSTGRALERRNDGAYAVLLLQSACTMASEPVIRYTLMREVDPTHRGIVKIVRIGQATAVSMLDPTQPRSLPAAAAGAPGRAAVPGSQPTREFLDAGMHHILGGYDHILFLLCLLLPSVVRRTPQGWQPVQRLRQALWPVAGIVSAFTVAHSLTLGLAAMQWVRLAPAFIEPAIAVTIIVAALDNLCPILPVPRVVATFLFGLIHGFGFAGVLTELNLPPLQFVRALLEFNIGIELGQLAIVLAVTTLLYALREQSRYRGWVVRGGSLCAIAIAGLWFVERVANVSLIPL